MTKENERPQPPSNDHRVTRVRNRVPRSCLACRTRKLKCNREKPCQNCVVRGKEASASCTYVGGANPKGTGLTNAKSGVDVKGRINRLESLVRSMISEDGDTQPGLASSLWSNLSQTEALPSMMMQLSPTDGSKTKDSKAHIDISGIPGGQKVSKDTRSTHWDVILNDICAIKDAWNEKDDFEVGADGKVDLVDLRHRPSFLTGLSPPPDRETLLASLPNKQDADKLLQRFFETYNPALPARCAIHVPTFLKHYQRHWEDPTNTKIIWVGLIFGIFALAMHSYRGNDQEPKEYEGMSTTLFNVYRVRTAQCLEVANITRPTEYMIEVLLLYSMIEYVDQRDGEMGVWLLSGLIMRLALQQGYHRDPSNLPNLTPFQAEMRRRIWVLVANHELLFSVQIGVPRNIRYAECDSETPRNIYESELDENMQELPPARPLTEPTEISYQITKNRIMRAYGMVIEHLHILQTPSYDEVMRLDGILIEARDMIPLHLQWLPMDQMAGISEGRIMERCILQLFWHKAMCVLHRKYLTSPDAMYSYSKRTCVSSALALLRQQATLHGESHLGGRLPRTRWWGFSLQNHDYLLAAMIICLALYHEKRQEEASETMMSGTGKLHQRSEMFDALMRAKDIWAEISGICGDARKAINILSSVMEKLGMGASQQQGGLMLPIQRKEGDGISEGSESGNTLGSTQKTFSTPSDQNISEISWNTEYSPQNGGESFGAQPYQNADAITDNIFSSNGMFSTWEPNLDLPENLDWAAWDLYVNRNNQLLRVEAGSWPGTTFELPSDMAYQLDPGWHIS